MRCPTCQGKTSVLDTRDGVRRRVCEDCAARFTTHEVVVGEHGDRRGALPQFPLGATQKRVLAVLEGQALTAVEMLARLDGCSRTQLMDAVRMLRRRRLIYIAGYAPRPGGVKFGRRPPQYALGDRPDAVEPPAVPKKERDFAYRERKRRTGETLWRGLVT